MSISLEVGQLGVEVLNAARRWARARGILRRMLDSKTTTKQKKDAAKRAYDKVNNELETLVGKLETAMRASGPTVSMDKKRADFPWRKLFGMISEVAKAVETTVDAPGKVIDATPPSRE